MKMFYVLSLFAAADLSAQTIRVEEPLRPIPSGWTLIRAEDALTTRTVRLLNEDLGATRVTRPSTRTVFTKSGETTRTVQTSVWVRRRRVREVQRALPRSGVREVDGSYYANRLALRDIRREKGLLPRRRERLR